MSVPVDELKNRLKEAIAFMNMRAIDLSLKTGIPKSSISQYLSGHVKPNSERVYLISKALDVNEAWLMGFDVPKERDLANEKEISPLPSTTLTDAEKTLLTKYRQLSSIGQRKLLDFCDDLISSGKYTATSKEHGYKIAALGGTATQGDDQPPIEEKIIT